MAKRSNVIIRLYVFVSGVILLGVPLFLMTDGKFLSNLLPKPEKKYPVIGTIEFSIGDTRVRSAGELLWVPSGANAQLYDNDSVFTGPDGKMTIFLNSNTRLQVNKNSLFKISKKNHLTTIHLIQGEMKTSSTAKDTIKVQHEDKSKFLKLSEVEERLSPEALAALPMPETIPNSLELTEALAEPEPTFENHRNSYADTGLPLPKLESESLPQKTEVRAILNQEGNQKILWLLGIGYALFSLLALRELIVNKKLSE